MDDLQNLSEWFNGVDPKDLPTPPFELRPGHRVIGVLFYQRLKEEIARGEQSARALTGALQQDLESLRTIIEAKR